MFLKVEKEFTTNESVKSSFTFLLSFLFFYLSPNDYQLRLKVFRIYLWGFRLNPTFFFTLLLPLFDQNDCASFIHQFWFGFL